MINKQTLRDGMLKSIGFLVLCIGQILLNISIITPAVTAYQYAQIQLAFWMLLFIWFVPNMYLRELKGVFGNKRLDKIESDLKDIKNLLNDK